MFYVRIDLLLMGIRAEVRAEAGPGLFSLPPCSKKLLTHSFKGVKYHKILVTPLHLTLILKVGIWLGDHWSPISEKRWGFYFEVITPGRFPGPTLA